MAQRRTEAVHRRCRGAGYPARRTPCSARAGRRPGRGRRCRPCRHPRRLPKPRESIADSLAGGGQACLCRGRQLRPDGAGRRAGTSRHLRHCPRPHRISCSRAATEALVNLAGATGRRCRRRPRAMSQAAGLGAGDCLIAVSASGSTPYAIGCARGGAGAGAPPPSPSPTMPARRCSTWPTSPSCWQTPPEVIAGSTRMGAGTAQKIALNMMSTLAAIHLGHVHDGYMVNLIADNMKLRDRAARIVAAIAGCDTDERRAACSNGAAARSRRPSCLRQGAGSAEAAKQTTGQRPARNLRPALSASSRGAGGRDLVSSKAEPDKGQQGD